MLLGLGGLFALWRRFLGSEDIREFLVFVTLALGLGVADGASAAAMTPEKLCGPTEVRTAISATNVMGGELGITRCDAVTTIEAITEVVLSGHGPAQTFRYASLRRAIAIGTG